MSSANTSLSRAHIREEVVAPLVAAWGTKMSAYITTRMSGKPVSQLCRSLCSAATTTPTRTFLREARQCGLGRAALSLSRSIR